MRQLQKPPKGNGKPRKKPREPLEEGIVVPIDSAGRRMWGKMSDEQIVAYARRFTKERGILSRKEFQEKDCGFYRILSVRKLLHSAFEGMNPKHRTYPKDPDELVNQASAFIQENHIKGRSDLQKRDNRLYTVLLRRNLLGAAFEGIKRKQRVYPDDPEQLLAYARKFMQKKGISSRGELKKNSGGLYVTLHKRKLLDAAFEGINPKRKTYPKDPEEFVAYARKFLQENGITSRSNLFTMDRNFYAALHRRKLLDAVFSEVESDQQKAAVQEVLDELEEFGGSE